MIYGGVPIAPIVAVTPQQEKVRLGSEEYEWKAGNSFKK